jgi:hypothetical protein
MIATRIRVLVDLVSVALCGVSVALILANLSSPARPFAVLLATVVGTGWALSGWINLPDDAAYVGTMTIGLGFAVPIALGVLLVEAGYWHPQGEMAVLLGGAGVLNVLLLIRDARRLATR